MAGARPRECHGQLPDLVELKSGADRAGVFASGSWRLPGWGFLAGGGTWRPGLLA
jgi:hypothetical protein